MRNYRIEFKADEVIYWPFWPFRVDKLTAKLSRGFRLQVYQREGDGWTQEPIEIQGYVSTDGEEVTTTVNFLQGSRLKRVTPVQR